jgi:ribosomal protein L22
MISSEKNSAGPTSLQAADHGLAARSCRGMRVRAALQVLVRVLDHHDGRVDHRADGDRDAAQAHQVGTHAQQRMAMKAIRMPTGSIRMATSALRTCIRKTTQTSATMSDSSSSVRLRVSMAR